MPNPAGTLIVPPLYEAQIAGVDSVLITARMVILMKDGRRCASRRLLRTSLPASGRFLDLVSFVREVQAPPSPARLEFKTF